MLPESLKQPPIHPVALETFEKMKFTMAQMRVAIMLAQGIRIERGETTSRPFPRPRYKDEEGMNSPSGAAPRTSKPKPSTPLKSTTAPARPARNNGMNSPSSPAPRPPGPTPSTRLKPKAAPPPAAPAKPASSGSVSARTNPAKSSPESSASRAGNGTGPNIPAGPGASTGDRPKLHLAIPRQPLLLDT
jgi:hypothetical protein